MIPESNMPKFRTLAESLTENFLLSLIRIILKNDGYVLLVALI